MESKTLGLEVWDLAKLVPHPGNAKLHSKEQVRTLAGLIKTYGWTQPIVVEADGTIIAGHGRRLAAIELGMTRVPVVCRSDLTKAEAEAMRLSDNRAASNSYDTELLQQALKGLALEYEDLGFLGFDEKELSFLSEDISQMDESLFVTDIQEAVEAQREENDKRTDEVDRSDAPLADAFGFRRFTIAQSRRVKSFMTKLEAETGKKGAEALVIFLDNLEA